MIRFTIDVIGVLLLIISIFAIVGELSRNKTANYWIAAISFYIISFIAENGFALIVAFVMLTLAIGSSVNIINSKLKMNLFVGLGILLGLTVMGYVYPYYYDWLYSPFIVTKLNRLM